MILVSYTGTSIAELNVLNHAAVTIIISNTIQVKDENNFMLKGRCAVVRYVITLALLYVLVVGLLDRKLAKSTSGWYMAVMTVYRAHVVSRVKFCLSCFAPFT